MVCICRTMQVMFGWISDNFQMTQGIRARKVPILVMRRRLADIAARAGLRSRP